MKSALDEICERVNKLYSPSVQAGTDVREKGTKLSVNGSVIVKDLLVYDGSLEGKDDGCNTNVFSHENRSCSKRKHSNVKVKHSGAD